MTYGNGKGEKTGLIKINFRYVPDDNRIDYLGVKFSDPDIQRSIQNTPLLFDQQSQIRNQLEKDFTSSFDLKVLVYLCR